MGKPKVDKETDKKRGSLHFPSKDAMPNLLVRGVKVWNRDGSVHGTTTGGSRMCPVEGCGGAAVGVRWSDGKLTFPCVRGMEPYQDGAKIR